MNPYVCTALILSTASAFLAISGQTALQPFADFLGLYSLFYWHSKRRYRYHYAMILLVLCLWMAPQAIVRKIVTNTHTTP